MGGVKNVNMRALFHHVKNARSNQSSFMIFFTAIVLPCFTCR
jgi:hypothetical protein